MGGSSSHVSKPTRLDSTPWRLASWVILDSVYFCSIAAFGSFFPPWGPSRGPYPLNHLTGPRGHLLHGNLGNSNCLLTIKTNLITTERGAPKPNSLQPDSQRFFLLF